MVDPISLKKYLQSRRIAPLKDILNHFRVEREVVEPMIDLWIKKGKVVKRGGKTACKKGCCKCDPAIIEFYEWTG